LLAFPMVILTDTLQKQSTVRRRLRSLVRPRA
jgi:hypothetical protein